MNRTGPATRLPAPDPATGNTPVTARRAGPVPTGSSSSSHSVFRFPCFRNKLMDVRTRTSLINHLYPTPTNLRRLLIPTTQTPGVAFKLSPLAIWHAASTNGPFINVHHVLPHQTVSSQPFTIQWQHMVTPSPRVEPPSDPTWRGGTERSSTNSLQFITVLAFFGNVAELSPFAALKHTFYRVAPYSKLSTCRPTHPHSLLIGIE